MFTLKALIVCWHESHSSAENFRICNARRNHLRGVLKMQVPRFTPQDGVPESACLLANVPGGFRTQWGNYSRVQNSLTIKIHRYPSVLSTDPAITECVFINDT